MKQMYIEEEVCRERETFVLKKCEEKASRLRELDFHAQSLIP